MPLTHFTERHFVRLVATQTRRADLNPRELSQTHIALGRFLGAELVERLPLEPCEIAHPQGPRQGWRLARETDIALLCFMRAGLYIAEGVREVLPSAPLFHVSPRRDVGLSDAELTALSPIESRTLVIIDSVVNTGASLEPVLRQLAARGAGMLAVLSLVTPVTTAERLAATYPEVHFLFARVSENQYVGRGATDTGNRLFGTLPPKASRDS